MTDVLEQYRINAWGVKVPVPPCVYRYPRTCQLLQRVLRQFWGYLGVPTERADDLCANVFANIVEHKGSEDELETSLRKLVACVGDSEAVQRALSDRTDLILRQVTPFIEGPRVLDFGCGDGEVGRRLAEQFEVEMADIMDYRSAASRHLPFTPLTDGRASTYGDAQFDTVLALTVFHHSAMVQQTISDAIRMARRRVLVIESVYGILPTTPLRGLNLRGAVLCDRDDANAFAQLRREEQLAYCSFIDWFYNRVLHDGVPVPLNFNTPARWKKAFASAGARQIVMYHLGLDQVAVPEFHTLHVLEPIRIGRP